jgi:hypothetical protein
MAYQLFGPGWSSCGTWTADRRTNVIAYQLDLAWVLGFLAGVGYMGGEKNLDPLQGLDSHAVAAWIDAYCQRYPPRKIADAAAAFLTAHPR